MLLFLKASRPRFWIYVLGPYAVGAAAALPNLHTWPGILPLIFAGFFTYSANLFIYGINDIYDFETDKTNAKKLAYEQTLAPAQHTKMWRLICLSTLPWLALLPFLPLPASLATLLFLFLGWAYSAPPIRAKIRPGLDSLSNVLYILPGLAGFYAVGGQSPNLILVSAAMLWAIAMHAYSAVPDIQADTQAGLKTIATTLGARATLIACGALYVTAGALLASVELWQGLAGILVYALMIMISLWVEPKQQLLQVYKFFPSINTLFGMLLFFTALL